MNAFEEFCFDENYVLRFYRVDQGLVCSINENMVPELRKIETKIRERQEQDKRLFEAVKNADDIWNRATKGLE